MKRCQRCNFDNRDEDFFCGNCGTPIQSTPSSAPAAAPAPAPQPEPDLDHYSTLPVGMPQVNAATRGGAPTGPAAKVVILAGPRENQEIVLDAQESIIGRAPTCEIALDDKSVSRRHASITRSADMYLINDLRSSNGTLLNGDTVTSPRQLHAGDMIKAGDVPLLFKAPEAPAPAEKDGTLAFSLPDMNAMMAQMQQQTPQAPVPFPQPATHESSTQAVPLGDMAAMMAQMAQGGVPGAMPPAPRPSPLPGALPGLPNMPSPLPAARPPAMPGLQPTPAPMSPLASAAAQRPATWPPPTQTPRSPVAAAPIGAAGLTPQSGAEMQEKLSTAYRSLLAVAERIAALSGAPASVGGGAVGGASSQLQAELQKLVSLDAATIEQLHFAAAYQALERVAASPNDISLLFALAQQANDLLNLLRFHQATMQSLSRLSSS